MIDFARPWIADPPIVVLAMLVARSSRRVAARAARGVVRIRGDSESII